MPKNKVFSNQVPLIKSSRGTVIQPDLLLAIKDGKIRIAKLNLGTDLYKLIRQLESVVDNLKDIRYEEQKKK